MLKVNPPLKITLLTLSYLFLLSACGGGGGGGAIPEKDKTPPVISSKNPDTREIDVDIFKSFTITFNENINTVTENNIVLLKYQTTNPNSFDENLQAVDRVKVTVTPGNNKLIINPVPGVSNGFVEYTTESRYKLTLLNIEDSNGNPMAETTWEFATTTIPSVNSVLPLKDETVSQASDVTITFSEAMDQTSLESGFSLEDLGLIGAANPPAPIKIQGVSMVYVDSTNTATYKLPDSEPLLNANSIYRVTLSNAKDLKGNIAPTSNTTFNTNNVTTNTELKTQPSAVIATAHSDRVDIIWAAAPAISGASQFTYNVYVSTDNITYDLLTKTGPIKLLTFTDSNIKPDIKHYYAVTANANGLESLKIFSTVAVTPRSLINFPTGSIVTVKFGDSVVNVSWPSVAAISYNIYVKVDKAVTFVKLNKKPITINKFLHNSDSIVSTVPVVNGSSYIYIIKAVNGNSEEGTATLESEPALPVAPKFGEFTFLNNSSSISENGIKTKITISRQNGNDGDVSVSYKLSDIAKPGILSATGGVDYIVKSGTIPIAAGVNEYIFYIDIKDDKLFEGDEKFEVIITSVTGGAKIGAIATHTITIIDDEIPPKLTMTPEFKKLNFSWTPPSTLNTVYYRLLVNKSGNSGFVTLLDNISTPNTTITVPVVLTTLTIDPLNPNLSGVTRHPLVDDSYILEACFNAQCMNSVSSNVIFRKNSLGETSLTKTTTILTSDNPKTSSKFGGRGFLERRTGISISKDGNTLAIGDSNNDELPVQGLPKVSNGIVQVYKLINNVWKKDGNKISKNIGFGDSVSLSSDGNTLAVGDTGINFTPTGGVELKSVGGAYIYKRNLSGIFVQTGNVLLADIPEEGAQFGKMVYLSGDGKTLAVGDSRVSLTDKLSRRSSAVTMFILNNLTTLWERQGGSFLGVALNGVRFGSEISLSYDGNTLILGDRDRSLGTVVDAGLIRIYSRIAGKWQLPGKEIYSSKRTDFGNFGEAISLSSDGNTIAITEIKRAITNKDGTNTILPTTITLIQRVAGVWQIPGKEIQFNNVKQVSLSDDGTTLVIGHADATFSIGLITILKLVGNIWKNELPVITSDTPTLSGPNFVKTAIISGDGKTTVVTDSRRNFKTSTGVSISSAGAVIIY